MNIKKRRKKMDAAIAKLTVDGVVGQTKIQIENGVLISYKGKQWTD